MSETSGQSAIAKLKAKAAALSALAGFSEQHVALASAGVFVHGGMNAKWDPKDHPRDPNNGEFVEQGKGVFLFGKSKTAQFSMSDGQKKPVELKPGDAAYKTKVGNVVVAHANGTFTLHDESGNSVQLQENSSTVTALKNNELAKIGENPGVEVEAQDQAEAADKIAHPTKYDPDDTSTPTLPSAEKQAVADKETALPNSVQFAGKTFDLLPGEKAYTSANDGSLVKIGADGKITYYDSQGEEWDGNGAWDQQKFQQWFASYGDDGGAYYTKVAEGTASTTTAPKGSEEEKQAKEQIDADLGAKEEKPEGVKESLEAPEVQKSGDQPTAEANEKAESVKPEFKHPVSGATFPVNPGDKVYQHKASPNSYIIAGEGEPVFFNKNGKQQKVPAHTLKKLGTNYNEVSDSYPGAKSDAPASKVDPADQAMADAMGKAIKEGVDVLDAKKIGEAAYAEAKGKTSANTLAAKKEMLKTAGKGEQEQPKSAVENLKEKAAAPPKAKSPVGTVVDFSSVQFKVNEDGVWEFEGQPVTDKKTIANLEDEAKAQVPDEPKPVELKGKVTPDKIKAMQPGDTFYAVFKNTGKKSWYVKQDDGTFQAFNENGQGGKGTEAKIIGAVQTSGDKFKFSFTEPKSAAPSSPFVNGDEFVHPVEGVIGLQLSPGAVIKQHKLVPESFLVVHPSGHIDKINKNGNIQKPGTALKVMDTNYKDVFTVPQPYVHKDDDEAEEVEETEAPEAPKVEAPAAPTTLPDDGDPITAAHLPLMKTGAKITLTKNTGVPTSVWTKQEDGQWHSPQMGSTVPESSVEQFLGMPEMKFSMGDALDKPEEKDEPEVEAPKTPAKKAAAPKKKAAATSDHTYALPNGEAVKLKPGEVLVTSQMTVNGKPQMGYILAAKEGKGYNQAWDENGLPVNVAKWLSKTQIKQQAKNSGGSVLDEYKLATTKVDTDSYEAKDISAKTYQGATDAVEEGKKSLTDALPMKHSWWNGWQLDNWQEIKDSEGNPAQWMNLSDEEKLLKVGALEEPAGIAAATLAQVSKWPSDALDKSDKTKISKEKTRFATVNRIALLAKNLLDDDSEWDEAKFTEEMAFAQAKYDKPGTAFGKEFPFPISDIFPVMSKVNAQRAFKKSLTGLEFDPYNASTEDYDKYAKSKGEQHLSALNPDQQKQWVLSELGDPTISAYAKKDLTNALKTAKGKAALSEMASVLAAKKKEADAHLPEKVSPVPADQAITGFSKKSDMAKTYKWTADTGANVTATQVGNDDWLLEGDAPGSTTLHFSDAVIQQTVENLKNNGIEVTAEGNAYGGPGYLTGIKNLEAKYEFNIATASQPQMNTLIKGEGGNYVGKMNATEKAEWVEWAAVGDIIGQYGVEHQAVSKGTTPHKNASTHAGSWESPQGKAAYGTLAGQLLGTEWGKKLLGNGSTKDWLFEDYKQAFTDLSLVPTYAPYQNKAADDLPSSIVIGSVQKWLKYHASAPQIAAMKENGPEVQAQVYDKPEAPKPEDVSDDAWSLVTNLTDDADLSSLIGDALAKMGEGDLDKHLQNSSHAKNHGLIAPVLGGVPLNVKRLAVWAATAMANYDADESKTQVMQAVAAKVKNGDYLDAATPVWIGPDGSKYPISPGAEVWKYNNDPNQFIITGPPNADGSLTGGYEVSSYGISQASSYKISNLEGYGYKKVFTMPGAVSWEKAKSENPDFYLPFWEMVDEAEAGKSTQFSSTLTGAQLTYELKNSGTLKDYPHLQQQYKTLPEGIRQLVLGAIEEHESTLLDIIEYKTKEGHYASAQTLPFFDPAKPYAKNISLGQFETGDIATHWTTQAQNAFVADYGLNDSGEIPAFIQNLFDPPSTVPASSKLLPADLQLTKLKNHNLGGMHTKYQWTDQDGNPWMSKTFQSDPMKEMRVDAEDAANKIGRLFGFRQPETRVMTLDGQYSYVQHLAPSTGTLLSKGPKDLSLKQLTQAMEEHINDWLVANHDTHPDNLMIDPDGNVFGIDKGQAFKFFPNDKLAHGYLPPGNGAPVWYDQFYAAVKSGKLDKETVDAVTKSVLRKAQKIAKANDAEYKSLLEYGLGKRTNWPAQYPSREKFIDGLLERKHDVFEDFVEFYKGVYADSPYEFDIDVENLAPAKLDDHTHLAVSQDLADDVVKAGAHGKALFFASTDLEDSHLLINKVLGQDGKAMLTGEAKMRKDADLILHNWLKDQTIEKTITTQDQSYAAPAKSHTDLPMAAQWYSTIVQGAKTVSTHASDGAYNESTLQQMTNTEEQIKTVLEALDEWEQENPLKPFKGKISGMEVELVTAEQQNAWREAMNQMLTNIAQVNKHKSEGTKVSPHFQQYVYTPSADVENTSGVPKMTIHWQATNGNKYAKWDDGGYTLTSADGDMKKIDPQQWKTDIVQGGVSVKSIPLEGDLSDAGDESNFFANDGTHFQKSDYDGKWYETSEEGQVPSDQALTEKELKEQYPEFGAGAVEETTVNVQVGTKVLKVTHKPAAAFAGKMNLATGELEVSGMLGKEFSGSSYDDQGQTGSMYEIDFGNTVIEYRPWNEPGVKTSQQGLLRFRKKDWDGDAESIDEVLDALRHMGVDLTPADDESMELFYWRHMVGVLQDREDRNATKWKKTLDGIQAAWDKKPDMTRGEELEMLRAEWAKSMGQDVVDNADFKPRFSRFRPHNSQDDDTFTSGKPYWLRPDFSMADLKKIYGNTLPSSSLSDAYAASNIVQSGGMYSTEERLRILGQSITGMSSSEDQNTGGASYVFTRQNQSTSWGGQVFYHPRTALRTTNYAFSGDMYGKVDARKSHSSFDLAKASKHGGGGNELMIKNGLSMLDDIAVMQFPSQKLRQEAIDAYAKMGITEIHGLPITDVFVTDSSTAAKTIKKIWDQVLAEEAGSN